MPGGRFDEVARLFITVDEVFDLATQRWVIAAGFGQEGFAFVNRAVERGVENKNFRVSY